MMNKNFFSNHLVDGYSPNVRLVLDALKKGAVPYDDDDDIRSGSQFGRSFEPQVGVVKRNKIRKARLEKLDLVS